MGGDCTGGERIAFDPFDLTLVADLVDAASDRSALPLVVSMFEKEALGLSIFWLPGILDRIDPRNERDDSFVSDLLNDG